MKLIILAAFTLVLCFRQEIAHAQCAELFTTSRDPVALNSTDRLISYLTQLLENNAIGERELVTLREGANPIPHKQTEFGPVFETSARRIQYQVVQSHMQSGGLDQARIESWAEQKLEETSRVRESREEVREETRRPYRKMEFHRLPPGEFRMGHPHTQVLVKLTHSIDMMSTPITQKMWVDVMGTNPSHFKEGAETNEIAIDGMRVRMQSDHPVENISWWSVVVFANRLSEKAGLKPAYDLSEVETEGRAEDGTLIVLKGDLKIVAPDENIYEAEGYRLPTASEQEYVLRNLGRAKGNYPHDLTEAEVTDYAWFLENSDGITHEVGTTPKSLFFDGKQFDDLIGNVSEWSHNGRFEVTGKSKTIDFDDKYRGYRTASYDLPLHCLRSFAIDDYVYPNSRYKSVGARLVRTVK